MNTPRALIASALALTPLIAPSASIVEAADDVIETLEAAGSFRQLIALLESTGIADELRGENPFTLFAPTDAAFGRLPKGALAELLEPENSARLESVLRHHVLSSRWTSESLKELPFSATRSGQRVDILWSRRSVKVEGATVVTRDLACDPGIVHAIDAVLLPNILDLVDAAVDGGKFGTATSLLKASGLDELLHGEGPYTLFVPNDLAFSALPAGTVEDLRRPENVDKLRAILRYHIIKGRVYTEQLEKLGTIDTLLRRPASVRTDGYAVWLNESKIIRRNVDTTNGVLHAVDRVLLPSE